MMRALSTLAVAAAAAVIAPAAHAGAEGGLDRYRALLLQKKTLQRENDILKQEAAMAATRSPYVLLDLQQGTMEFRIRGRTLKTYTMTSLSLDEQGARPIGAEQVWRSAGGPLTVLELEAGHPELIPPDPETGREAGLLYSDPNQIASQTGVVPLRTDAGILGVDVPTDYYIRFEEDVVFNIRTPREDGLHARAMDRLHMLLGDLKAAVAGLWGGGDAGDEQKPRLEIFLTTDPDTARNLHHSLLPGEKIYIVPPPAPPIALVAAADDPSR